MEKEDTDYLTPTKHRFYKGVACVYLCAACPYAHTGACGFYSNGFCINLK